MLGDFMSSGVWIIFPIIGLIMMVLMMFRRGGGFFSRIFGRGGGFFSRREEPRSRSHRSEIQETETPLSILKSRYARGDISKEEFEEMKKDL